ncbi:MAG TPA: VanW family protein [Thermomicrobiales bacterium]|nr:VanW family protein [Thermomicrobiales bacterium]
MASKQYPRLVSRRSLIAGGIATLAATAGIAVPLTTRGSFYPGTSITGLDISGKTYDDALAMLHEHFAGFESTAVEFTFEAQRWAASLADLGYAIDYDTTLAAAYKHGRNDGVVERYSGILISTTSQSFPVSFTRDNETLTAFLAQMGEEIIGSARAARLYREGAEIKILADRDGRQLDVDRARQDTIAAVEEARRATVELTVQPVVSQVSTEDLEPLRAQTQTLISAPVVIRSGDHKWQIEQETLIEALVLPVPPEYTPPALTTDRIAPILEAIAKEMYAAPRNAVLGWDGGLYVVDNDVAGAAVDTEALTAAVLATAATEGARTIKLPMREVRADVRADNLDELGIVDYIAEGSSSFVGSSEERAANVRISADHITHTLIPPGGTCSFNDAIGPITIDNGFVEGKIIQGDWYTSDIGGGACQVSTTVFRAALFAGLEFAEWHAHAFRLAFYEADGSPPGLDAAIYQPNTPDEWEADLKFVNPTESWMLLEMSTANEVATAYLYGTPPGWDVEISQPTVSDPIEPDPPKDRVDQRLKKGERRMVQTASPGYDVSVDRTVTKDGEVVSQRTFYSAYQPQQEIWAVGPGTPSQTSIEE